MVKEIFCFMRLSQSTVAPILANQRNVTVGGGNSVLTHLKQIMTADEIKPTAIEEELAFSVSGGDVGNMEKLSFRRVQAAESVSAKDEHLSLSSEHSFPNGAYGLICGAEQTVALSLLKRAVGENTEIEGVGNRGSRAGSIYGIYAAKRSVA